MDVTFRTTRPRSGAGLSAICDLLAEDGLDLDPGLELMITAHDAGGGLMACAGLDRDVVKCVAIRKSARGEGLALPLMTEVMANAWDMGHKDLFLYTKPENETLFRGCGFTPLARVPGKAVLMENNPRRLAEYGEHLAALREPGLTAAGLVMNCNPFTLGHRYLVEEAAKRTDWAHVFVVREDASLFPYADRLELVRAGVAGIPNVTVHPGSVYILSRATFPAYFLKDAADVDKAYTGIDIQIFRKYIAPPLGITHRFAGSEPYSAVTRRYNEDMAYWLAAPEVDAPPVRFEVLPRLEKDGEVISASRVRAAWRDTGLESVRRMVPESTYEYLEKHPDLARPGRKPEEGIV